MREIKLSETQSNIISGPPDKFQLVLAPPGTGKTLIVSRRIKDLIERQHIDPQDILVLCFTRAAAKVIIDRLHELILDAKSHDDLRFVTVRTFDSFATLVLLQLDETRDLSRYDFDGRIKLLNSELKKENGAAQDIIKRYKHLIVDEIQDLNGLRARMVQNILTLLTGGFTVLGDPAQAIYDFVLPNSEDKLTSDQLLSWIRSKQWRTPLEEIELSTNYRSSEDLLKITNELRRWSLEAKNDDDNAYTSLVNFVSSLSSEGSGEKPGERIKSPQFDTVCILCRTNGEVLQTASLLQSSNIRFSFRQNQEDYGLPPWIGRLFSDYQHRTISTGEFEDIWKEKEVDGNFEIGWAILKKIEGGQSIDLNIEKIHSRLLKGARLPDDLDPFTNMQNEKISLSTIHSSKGREFDHVIVLEPSRRNEGDWEGNLDEEAKILYVAATRAKKELSKLTRGGIPRLQQVDLGNGRSRWISSLWNSKFHFVEVGGPGDIDGKSFASQYIYSTEKQISEVQNRLWNQRNQMFFVDMKKHRNGRYSFFRLNFSQENNAICDMSISFRNDIRSLLEKLTKKDSYSYPYYWKNVPVVAVVTEVFEKHQQGLLSPYVRTGFVLSIRIRSMVYILG